MARYTGPVTKKSRRLKTDLVGGDQAFERRPFPPGQHGRARTKEKEYLTQLQEKQKARFTYGVMEKQFRRYYAEAASRPGKTGDTLLQILESRLDNVVYRAGLARTRRLSRQLVTHGHFVVNGVRVDVPSYRVEQYDIITVRKQSTETFPFELARATFGDRPIPAWMKVVPESLHDPDPLAAGACADRLAGHRAADRGVLLQVSAAAGNDRLRRIQTFDRAGSNVVARSTSRSQRTRVVRAAAKLIRAGEAGQHGRWTRPLDRPLQYPAVTSYGGRHLRKEIDPPC